jgi:RNA polymerase sigma factor (sigma-70 family)
MEIDDLVLAVQGGDSRAWTRLASLLAADLRPFFRRCCGGSGDDASDLIQSTLMVVHRKLPQFEVRAGEPFRSWVRTIARIEAQAALRQRGRRNRLEAAARIAADKGMPSSPNLGSRLDWARHYVVVEQALGKLGSRYRLVIEHDLAEGNDSTFAQRQGIKRGSVRTRRRRAYQMLRRLARKRSKGGRDTTPQPR